MRPAARTPPCFHDEDMVWPGDTLAARAHRCLHSNLHSRPSHHPRPYQHCTSHQCARRSAAGLSFRLLQSRGRILGLPGPPQHSDWSRDPVGSACTFDGQRRCCATKMADHEPTRKQTSLARKCLSTYRRSRHIVALHHRSLSTDRVALLPLAAPLYRVHKPEHRSLPCTESISHKAS